jgi:membrane associated rhomboid family serine protease
MTILIPVGTSMRNLNTFEIIEISGSLSHSDAIDYISIYAGSQVVSALPWMYFGYEEYFQSPVLSIIVMPAAGAIGGYIGYNIAQYFKTDKKKWCE